LTTPASGAALQATRYDVPLRGGSGHAAALRRLKAPHFGRAMRERSVLRRFSVVLRGGAWHGPVVSAASIAGMDTLSTHDARLLGLDDSWRVDAVDLRLNERRASDNRKSCS